MPGKCPGCGATTTPEARFCRRCGAPLKTGGGHDTAAPISPVAQTVPLADEGRATDGLAAEESQRLGEGTSRIKRAEMDELLRRIARDHSDSLAVPERDGEGLPASPAPAQADGSTKAAPVTNGLKAFNAENASLPQTESGIAPQTETVAASATPAETSATPVQAASGQRSGKGWRWAAAVLLFAVLGAGLLAVISVRRSKAAREGSTTAAPSGEEPQTSAAESGGQQIEPLTLESPQPANTTVQAPLPPARVPDAGAAAHPAGPTSPAVSYASPQPTPASTPDARQ